MLWPPSLQCHPLTVKQMGRHGDSQMGRPALAVPRHTLTHTHNMHVHAHTCIHTHIHTTHKMAQ